MMKPVRELTPKEIRSIRKLVTTSVQTTTRNMDACRWTVSVRC